MHSGNNLRVISGNLRFFTKLYDTLGYFEVLQGEKLKLRKVPPFQVRPVKHLTVLSSNLRGFKIVTPGNFTKLYETFVKHGQVS